MRRLLALVVLLLAILGGSVGATQFLASQFRHAPQLGQPLTSAGSIRLYPPHRWFTWKRLWGPYAPRPFGIATGVALGGLLFGFGLAHVVAGGGSRQPKPTGAYGTARWAENSELKEAHLLGERGVVLCQTGDAVIKRRLFGGWKLISPGQLIRYDGQEHVLVFAPTGSGKGVGVVLPTLLSCPDSVVVYDIKRENWQKTAGWRSLYSHCLRVEPSARGSVRFNVLMEVRAWPYDVRDAQSIGEIVVNPDSLTEEQRDHWKLTGADFLVAVILHVLYAEKDKSLAGVLKAMTDPDRSLNGLLEAMLHTRHLGDRRHPSVASSARAMLDRSANERSGVVSTAVSFLSLYRDPIIAENTSVSDFTLADLMCGERPVSLYLVVPPNDMDRTKPLMRLLLNFFGRRLTEDIDYVGGLTGKRRKRHRLLYLIDEFPSLGRMPFFEVQQAFLRGYGVKCMLIAQSLNQLDKAYGQNHSIVDNCHVRMTYSANCERTAKRISEMLGHASLMKVQISEGEGKGLLGKGHVTKSYQEFGRPLKTPDEIQSLPYSDALLMMGNLRPYQAKKVLVYDDPRFRGRDAIPAPSGRRERAELPPQRGVPHWLTLPPPTMDEPAADEQNGFEDAPGVGMARVGLVVGRRRTTEPRSPTAAPPATSGSPAPSVAARWEREEEDPDSIGDPS